MTQVSPPPPARALPALTARLRRHFSWCRRRPLLAPFLYLCGLCPLAMLVLDKPLALAIKRGVDPDLFGFFQTITPLGLSGGWFALSGIATLGCLILWKRALGIPARERFLALAWSWGFFLAAQASSGLFVMVVKRLIGRLRPRLLFNDGLYGFKPLSFASGAESFPSGHSQTVWAAMTALMVLFPRHWPWFLGTAVLVTLSRVVITVHYLSDTLMGAYIGLFAVVVLRPWFERGRPGALRIGKPL
ncbi:phosphoesterase [Rhodospirillum rubrum]|uniref:phosphatase PAP2 family protein n=1 Tax=Rhodospirillum rubrum TaxID=1085 RepID=UPI0019057401|nr:phosphatase PAP2 family protein [Rhodospirillum rubrum]MBK1663739.1 phosphoesterase [Rhodospirillum rubrum]MBK1676490.1 phosphoesterase [Rhodospirillum rubrum]